jgi:hypothetical protein
LGSTEAAANREKSFLSRRSLVSGRHRLIKQMTNQRQVRVISTRKEITDERMDGH